MGDRQAQQFGRVWNYQKTKYMILQRDREYEIFTNVTHLYHSIIVKKLVSSRCGSQQPGYPKGDFEGKLVDALWFLTAQREASVSTQQCCQPWNTITCKLLYSQLLATCEYGSKTISITVSALLIRH